MAGTLGYNPDVSATITTISTVRVTAAEATDTKAAAATADIPAVTKNSLQDKSPSCRISRREGILVWRLALFLRGCGTILKKELRLYTERRTT